MDCSLPGSSVHGILQAKILEWVAISFSRESSWPRDRTWVLYIAAGFFTIWATREAHSLGMNLNQSPHICSQLPSPTAPSQLPVVRTCAEVPPHLGEKLSRPPGKPLSVYIFWLLKPATYSVIKQEVWQPQFFLCQTEGLWFSFCCLNPGAYLSSEFYSFFPLPHFQPPPSFPVALACHRQHQRACMSIEF